MAALAFAAGVGPQYLRSSTPEDIAVYRGIAEKAAEVRDRERADLAKKTRNQIAEMLG